MLGTFPNHHPRSSPKKCRDTSPDHAEMGIVCQGIEQAGSGIRDVPAVRQEQPHVGPETPVGGIRSGIVPLVPIPRVEHDGLVQVLEEEFGGDSSPRVTVGPGGESPEFDGLSRDEVLDDMGTAITLFAGSGLLRCPDIGIDSCYAAICLDVIQPDLLHLDRGICMAKVQECAGRAHRPERTGRDHIHLSERSLFTELGNDRRHLLCRDHPCVSVPDPLPDQADGLFHSHDVFL
ncbi:MAG: hypothetical protein BWY93_02225 [Euryarchaeota archaeon ADurb.BinA087]|nr:MAG: hypothetical protein BWY93_02225 [Euryarchaeota archaeon ADurb.BinA087]